MGLGNLIGGGLGAFLGGPAGYALGSSLGSNFDGGERRQQQKKGLEYENRYFLEREQELYRRGVVERGLTPQEYYGSPAPGQSGPGGTVGQTLGNQSNVQNQLNTQVAMELYKTKMQTDAQIKVANIGRQGTQDTVAGNVAVQELRNLVEQQKVDLTRRQLEEVAIPAAAAQIGLTEEQIKVAINEIATSDPSFKREITLLTMGFDNTLQNMILRKNGVTLENMHKLSDEKYAALMAEMLGYSSKIGRELRGVVQSAADLIRALQDLPRQKIDFTGPTIGSGPP